MQGTAAFLAPKIVEFHAEAGSPRVLNAPAGSYRTADGWIALTLVKEHHFEKLCRAIGREELAEDPRFRSFATRGAHSDAIRDIVAAALAAGTTADWARRFAEQEVLASPIADFGDWLADPQVTGTDAAPVVDQPGMGSVPIPAIPGTDPEGSPASPGVGQHGREILGELGFDAAMVEGLVRDGAVTLPD